MRKPIGTRARTGESCPESGVWKTLSTPSTKAPFAVNNRMPPYNGVAVTWELIRMHDHLKPYGPTFRREVRSYGFRFVR